MISGFVKEALQVQNLAHRLGGVHLGEHLADDRLGIIDIVILSAIVDHHSVNLILDQLSIRHGPVEGSKHVTVPGLLQPPHKLFSGEGPRELRPVRLILIGRFIVERNSQVLVQLLQLFNSQRSFCEDALLRARLLHGCPLVESQVSDWFIVFFVITDYEASSLRNLRSGHFSHGALLQ